MACAQRFELVQQLAAVLLPLVGNPLGHDSFDDEAALRRVAAGGERLVASSPGSRPRRIAPAAAVSTM